MNDECPIDSQHKCDQNPRDCDGCRLGYLWATMEAARQDYFNALNKYIEKLKKEKKDDNV